MLHLFAHSINITTSFMMSGSSASETEEEEYYEVEKVIDHRFDKKVR